MSTSENHSFGPRIYYVTFPVGSGAQTMAVAAQLRIPMVQAKRLPAVVIVHGSAGLDSRGELHSRALNRVGIVTLEIDMWTARHFDGGPGAGRPQSAVETLLDAFAALRFLAGHPKVDAGRIGIMGFSWGGMVTMLSATRKYADHYMTGSEVRFAAHAPFYPVCWLYNKEPGYEFGDLTGAPVFIQVGALDDYDGPRGCHALRASLPKADRLVVEVKTYADTQHAFDRLEPAVSGFDRLGFQGRGGVVTLAPQAPAARQASDNTLAFFERAFNLPRP